MLPKNRNRPPSGGLLAPDLAQTALESRHPVVHLLGQRRSARLLPGRRGGGCRWRSHHVAVRAAVLQTVLALARRDLLHDAHPTESSGGSRTSIYSRSRFHSASKRRSRSC